MKSLPRASKHAPHPAELSQLNAQKVQEAGPCRTLAHAFTPYSQDGVRREGQRSSRPPGQHGEFQANLGYRMKLCLKKKKKLKTKNAKSARAGFGKQSTSLAYTKHAGFQLRHLSTIHQNFFFPREEPLFLERFLFKNYGQFSMVVHPSIPAFRRLK